jgi:hypothetical protein
MHERASILGALDAALRGAQPAPSNTQDAIRKWHAAAHVAFLKEVANRGGCKQFAQSHWQLSYSIERSDEQQLSRQSLLQTLRETNSEVRDLIKTGWSMFYVFDVPEIRPLWQTDAASGLEENDFLECALLRETRDRDSRPLYPDL